jgi:hypothetical protein
VGTSVADLSSLDFKKKAVSKKGAVIFIFKELECY